MGESAIRDRIAKSSGWQVSRQLGRGQYGTAYLVGWDNTKCGEERKDTYKDGEQAVAKVVGLEFLPEKEHNLAFQEVELMRALQHPHIVALRDHFITEASLELCIVMEFCDSGDLRGVVKERTQVKPPKLIPEPQIMTWFVQMTLALNYMHLRHILHRDLKSSNVFLTTNASKGHDVRLGDFGISRVLEGTVDVAATVVGTPYYMSPEVCKAEPYGYKSDIWALGCVLYEMCMLKHAFESQSLLGLVYKIVSETYEAIPAQYSGELRTLIDHILDKSSNARPSGTELMSRPYVRRFDVNGQADKDAIRARAGSAGPDGSVAQDASTEEKPCPPAASAPARTSASLGPMSGAKSRPPPADNMRTAEPSPGQPVTFEPAQDQPVRREWHASAQDQPVRREWHAPPFVAAGTPAQAGSNLPSSLQEAEFKVRVMLSRIRRALAARRQNWLQVFASFDQVGDGQLKEAEFERAIASMALGLSDSEVREVRVFLQGTSNCVPVDLFGNALHRIFPEVMQLEEWGRGLLGELAREARAQEDNNRGVFPGAQVRVHGLQSAAGAKLNGCEGVVDKWDAAACRWVVKISGVMKSIKDEHLESLGSAASPGPGGSGPGGDQDTIAIYRVLSEGGTSASLEGNFTAVCQRLLPSLVDSDLKRLILLLPKCPDGRVDVPEALSQLANGFNHSEQTLHLGATLAGAVPKGGVGSPPKLVPGPMDKNSSFAGRHVPPWGASPLKSAMSPMSPSRVPGSVASPRGEKTPGMSPGPGMSPVLGMPRGGGSSASDGGGSRAEAALLRLAQRLLGKQRAPGPGIEILRLFAARPESLHLDELMEAVSVLPLGISRAEVQTVFGYVRGPGASSLPLTQLGNAAEIANANGVPHEAAGLEQIDFKRLTPALLRFEAAGGRASPQEFRVAIMHAEPYMTHSQMEWMTHLTDKDGEGRLLPATLMLRLGVTGVTSSKAEPLSRINVPPRPSAPRTSVAQGMPQSLVVAAVLARVKSKLFRAGPNLSLGSILGLFDVADGSNRSQGSMVSRDHLGALLGNLRLGISIAEADELVNALASGGSKRIGADRTVQITLLYDLLDHADDADMESQVFELRDLAQQRLIGKGSVFAHATKALASDWISEVEFRRVLKAALAAEWSAGAMSEDDEDRLLLLAEKNAPGEICWRNFVQAFCGCPEVDQISELGDEPPSPTKKVRGSPAAMGISAQSWRSAKAAEKAEKLEKAERTVIMQAGKSYPDVPLSPKAHQPRTFCCLRRRITS
eukprot:TRINITY_DN8855_c0_g1_i1.p1 TRINITY_DN8855_c0_g1~~TRINITY_DN8855_c0_g1_i1.p1  ORF type:complete len:1259 (+),score=208.04 TRINITY_DN8855_c0_g1_i1:84-3860(+)